ncbi:MAG: hypothetical protein F6K58_05000 [Symploca sp. SIO2E9]|nr:hypothetical protein [Symploca sp. SIO2E9]
MGRGGDGSGRGVCTVVGIPGRIVRRFGQRLDLLEHSKLPDTQASVIQDLVKRLERLEKQLQTLDIGSDTITLKQEREVAHTCTNSSAQEHSHQNDVYTL